MTKKEEFNIAVEQLNKLIEEFSKNDRKYAKFGVKILVDNQEYINFLWEKAYCAREHFHYINQKKFPFETQKQTDSWLQNVLYKTGNQFVQSKGYNPKGKSETVINMMIDDPCDLGIETMLRIIWCSNNSTVFKYPMMYVNKDMPKGCKFVEFCPYDESQIEDYSIFMEYDEKDHYYKLKEEK